MAVDYISGGTVHDAILQSWRKDPQNRFVMQILQAGIRHSIKLSKQTPDDVLLWLKTSANEYQEGCGSTFHSC